MVFTHDDIQGFLRRQPFVPMQFVTTTGETFDIRHPELVVVSRHYIFIGLPTPEDPLLAERVTHVALVHLVEIRTLPTAPPPPTSNGVAQPV